jgi:hypothetical protein
MLYELLKDANLLAYPDPDIRLAIQRSVAVETARGIKITKERAAHNVDVVVALAIAALGAVEALQGPACSPEEVAALAEVNTGLRIANRYDSLSSLGSLSPLGPW